VRDSPRCLKRAKIAKIIIIIFIFIIIIAQPSSAGTVRWCWLCPLSLVALEELAQCRSTGSWSWDGLSVFQPTVRPSCAAVRSCTVVTWLGPRDSPQAIKLVKIVKIIIIISITLLNAHADMQQIHIRSNSMNMPCTYTKQSKKCIHVRYIHISTNNKNENNLKTLV
jgi:hypothetical protein